MANANLPWVESPFFDEILSSRNLSEEQAKLAREYNENGFVVISGVLPEELIDKVRHDAETKGFDPNFPIKTHRNEARVQDFWKVSDPSRDLARYPKILETSSFCTEGKQFHFKHLLSGWAASSVRIRTLYISAVCLRVLCAVFG